MTVDSIVWAEMGGERTRHGKCKYNCKCFLFLYTIFIQSYSIVLYNTRKCTMEANVGIQHNTQIDI